MQAQGANNPDETINWLMTQGPRCNGPAELLEGYCQYLRRAGVPVDRSTLGAPLLHPIAQSAYVFWDIETGAALRWFRWTPEAMETMRASPIHPIYSSGTASSLRLAQPEDRARYPIGDDLWGEGYRQYEALPLLFSDDTFKALTLATKSESGFDASNMATIKATMPALALVFEGFVARNAARTLMETYVGKRAGLRVLDGEIARGDGTHIDAVICFSDLRNFTTLAQSRDESALLDLLNDYFGRMTDAVEENEGEVLKFIGDAMLAVFPHDNDLAGAVARAETAATQVLKSETESKDYQFGLGLHPGSVFYGNIGGGTRLDFTVIGGAVNIASRIESLCAELGQPLLVSGDIVAHSGKEWTSVGSRQLKGVDQPMEIFAPVI
ncbi:MAG: adenylate/guanylate cyclase domain-containing protein [Pseudomonadota bacterium]